MRPAITVLVLGLLLVALPGCGVLHPVRFVKYVVDTASVAVTGEPVFTSPESADTPPQLPPKRPDGGRSDVLLVLLVGAVLCGGLLLVPQARALVPVVILAAGALSAVIVVKAHIIDILVVGVACAAGTAVYFLGLWLWARRTAARERELGDLLQTGIELGGSKETKATVSAIVDEAGLGGVLDERLAEKGYLKKGGRDATDGI